MTSERDIERVLDHWLTDRPTQVADRVLDEVAERIVRQPQRPAWRLQTWRPRTMSSSFRLVAAAAALVAVLLGGTIFLGGGGGPGPVPTATPTASPAPPSASASPIACEDDLPGCAGPLADGTHRSTNLVPPLNYETRGGSWSNVVDLPTVYKIDSAPTPGEPYIIVWTAASVTDQSVACSSEPDPARGQTAEDWVEVVTTHPGLVASEPVELFVSGRPAYQVELAVAEAWTQTCPGHDGPYVTLLTQPIEGRASEYGVPADQRMLLTVVDINRFTIVIQSYGPTDETAFDQAMEPIRALIDTFVMCGPSVGFGPCSSLGDPLPSDSAEPSGGAEP